MGFQFKRKRIERNTNREVFFYEIQSSLTFVHTLNGIWNFMQTTKAATFLFRKKISLDLATENKCKA